MYFFFLSVLLCNSGLPRIHAAQAGPELLASLLTAGIVGVSRHTWLSIVSLCFIYIFKRLILFVSMFAHLHVYCVHAGAPGLQKDWGYR